MTTQMKLLMMWSLLLSFQNRDTFKSHALHMVVNLQNATLPAQYDGNNF